MIVRQPLRDQVRANLTHRLLAGSLRPGARLRDSALAVELGVSRTPVREALLRLEREGIVSADLGHGFVVCPLTSREVREKYPIMWTLEILALRSSPLPSAQRLRRLRRLNEGIAREHSDLARRVELDTEWHALLLSDCPNASLTEMMGTLKASIRRYEIAYMHDAGPASESIEHHDHILVALEARDVDRAAMWLERNWAIGVDSLAAWLDDRGKSEDTPSGRQ
jgi:DNA-binding GntR family transcriptional regulator